jgi:hypothetical protein
MLNRNFRIKQCGGLIGKNTVQELIESIGFEFESLYLQPYIFIKNEDKFFSDDKYADEFYKTNLLDKMNMKKTINIINNTRNKFIMGVSSEYSREEATYTICSNIKKLNETIIPTEHADMSNKFYLKKTDGTVIEQKTDIEKHRDADTMEDMDEWRNICYKSNAEFTFTYATIDKSNNLIYECFNKSVKYLYDYFTKFCDTSVHSLNLIIFNRTTKEIKSDNVLFDKTTFYKQKFDGENKFGFLIINNNELFAKSIKGDDYVPTIDDIKWDIHMTFGVKLENVDKLLKYLSYYETDKLTNIIVIDSIFEAITLTSVFKLYVHNKWGGIIDYGNDLYNKFKGVITLMSYYCNIFTLNVSLDTKHLFTKYGYSFMLRNTFDKFVDFFRKFNESLPDVIKEFIIKIATDDPKLFTIITDDKLKFRLKEIIKKYMCRVSHTENTILELKKIIGDSYAEIDYVNIINNMTNLFTNLYYLFNAKQMKIHDILVYSTNQIEMNNDIVYIEYRGFRIDTFGNHIHSLKEYIDMSNDFITRDEVILPNNKEILMGNKHIVKLKIPKTEKYVMLLNGNIYKRKNADGSFLNIYLYS